MVQITRATTDTPLSLSHFRRLRTMVDLDCPEKISIILKHAPIVMESADCQEVIERAVIEKDCVLVGSMRVDHLEGYNGDLQTVTGRWKNGKSEVSLDINIKPQNESTPLYGTIEVCASIPSHLVDYDYDRRRFQEDWISGRQGRAYCVL